MSALVRLWRTPQRLRKAMLHGSCIESRIQKLNDIYFLTLDTEGRAKAARERYDHETCIMRRRG